MNACWCPEACQHPPVLVCFIIDGDGQSSVASLQQMLLMYACNHSAINRQICLTMLHTNCCIICRDCMSDSEEESYVYFGTALQEEAESRAGQHSKALQDPSLTKSLPVWKQASIHICFSLKCHACSLLSWPTSHAHWRTFLWTQVCHNALYAIAVLLSFVTMRLLLLLLKNTHMQEVTDAEGRRRFHGAFTGGYSAGLYNTVGSLEGWQPKTFKSSRDKRAEDRQATTQHYSKRSLCMSASGFNSCCRHSQMRQCNLPPVRRRTPCTWVL